MGQAQAASRIETASNAITAHPFVVRLNSSIRLVSEDLAALSRVLDRKLVVKKGKDVIVEGYVDNGLRIVESGVAIRYRLLHNGGRQIVDIVLPGEIIGFPGCFFDTAIFSVSAISRMEFHYVTLARL